MLPLPFLLLLYTNAATGGPAFDWRDCTDQACYVSDSCNGGGGSKFVSVASDREVMMQHECVFVMLIRPFSESKWVVQLHVQSPNMFEKRITLTHDHTILHECVVNADKSIHVRGSSDLLFEVHPDSYHMPDRMHCMYTVKTRGGTPIYTGELTAAFTIHGHERKLKADNMDDVMKYISCDGSKISMSSLKPAGADVVAAPVDATRTLLACPRGKAWKLMIEISGQLEELRSGRCIKWNGEHSYDLDMANDDLWSMTEFPAVCIAENGCSTCPAPLYAPCEKCARVHYQKGDEKQCAKLRCPDAPHPDKYLIGGKTYLGEPVCGRRTDGRYGWSIKDAFGKQIQFDSASCIRRVTCHDTSPVLQVCEHEKNCIKPISINFEEGEGMTCPDNLIMRFRANETYEWAGAYDIVCNPRTGRWTADLGPTKTLLPRNASVSCMVQPPDPLLFYGSIAVCVGVALLYATFLPYYFFNRKKWSEFDKNQRELSRKFAKVKEYPVSPEKSDRESSQQSEPILDKPIVDTRIYPDELTVKRTKNENNEGTNKGVVEYLRPREPEDKVDPFCKSRKEAGRRDWEKWIAQTGGVVREKKSREEVLRIRAEKHAAKERRLEEERKEKLEEEEKAKKAALSKKVENVGKPQSLMLATDKFLMQQKVEDRFITLGPPPPEVASPFTTPEKKRPPVRKYKRNTTRDALPIKLDTDSQEASALLLPKDDYKEDLFVTAREIRSTHAREKTGQTSSINDRAIETKSKTTASVKPPPSNKDGYVLIVNSDEERKKKKPKEKKMQKESERTELLPETFTAVDDDTTNVDMEQQKKKDDGKGTPVMMSPSPLTHTSAASSTGTGDTKRKRKKIRCVESKGETKGIDGRRKRKKEGTAQNVTPEGEKK